MTNPTMIKFGFPRSLVAETAHWAVLVRPQQPTLGALVLASKEPAQAFAEVSPAGFADLQRAIAGVEGMLRHFVRYQKINYLMLMMVDPDVHFHVIPRYDGMREFRGTAFPDAGWPGPPDLGKAVTLEADGIDALAAELRGLWPAGGR